MNRCAAPLLVALSLLAACSNDEPPVNNAAAPPLEQMSEDPGDWTALNGMIGRRPSESGLIDSSPISVDLNARLGSSAKAFRDAMMTAGPLTRQGNLLVSKGPNAWLVLDPEGHAFRAGLIRNGRLEEWQTAGTDVPRPR
ncbi:hypothetical protein V6R86_05175 [Sphingomonas kaistensis]|uniref:Lipoprotein n=1 Tax=Sphingomonas kaistensis TaxID=298708 RepID=A0ABZ2G0L3_9SPHN